MQIASGLCRGSPVYACTVNAPSEIETASSDRAELFMKELGRVGSFGSTDLGQLDFRLLIHILHVSLTARPLQNCLPYVLQTKALRVKLDSSPGQSQQFPMQVSNSSPLRVLTVPHASLNSSPL